MSIASDRQLFMLSFDHRHSFTGLLGIAGAPSEAERRRIGELKALIYAGLRLAIAGGAPAHACALLVDEEFGAEIARSARAAGLTLAMPVEQSGQDEFDFAFGDDFGGHIESFDPEFAKVLVRYNPDGDPRLNTRQASRLARLSDWLARHDRKLLFELLVPATRAQLAEVEGDSHAYDHQLRPALVVRAIAALQDAGVEPRIWKLEGLDTRADCVLAVAQARRQTRHDVECVVLGRGADLHRVADWLRQAAPVDGYIGFAVGRTIWEDALRGHLAGRLDADATSAQIAENYRRLIDVYNAAV
jgi:myo-inositol catabolism protein IolC